MQFMFWDDGDFYKRSWLSIMMHTNSSRRGLCILSIAGLKIGKWLHCCHRIHCQRQTFSSLKLLGKWQKGWSVVGLTADWVEMDPDKDQHMEFWNIFNDCLLHDCLFEYYIRKKSWKQTFWQ